MRAERGPRLAIRKKTNDRWTLNKDRQLLKYLMVP
jgi:hypothetical protein